MIVKVYRIKRDCISYREEIRFKTVFHKLYWQLVFKIKGFKIKDVTEEENIKKKVLK